MRPYVQDGKTPSKKKSRRGEKAINGVKKSLVKAKVSVVKSKRKFESTDADEVEDLLEQTQNGHPETPQGKVLAQKVAKASKASTPNKQMKKLKSLVTVAAKTEGQGRRVSERLRQKSSATAAAVEAVVTATNGINGDHKVEVGIDAMEVNGKVSNGGLLQRTMSKIWRIPEGITGVAYTDIQSVDSPSKQPEPEVIDTSKDSTDGKKDKSCVIS